MGVHWSEGPENSEVAAIREALGAIPLAKPSEYWLYTDAEGDWRVRRKGDPEERRFASREQALAFARLAVVRCASYSLYLQSSDGRMTQESFNWLPSRSTRGRKSEYRSRHMRP
jgi:hypothetical protein